jgi:two-component system chemotaxis response regulator CheB
MKKIKVLIADDSALMRGLLTEIINKDPELTVVGAVSDAYQARQEIKRLNPDVLTLDVEMPRMDGISFLDKLMRLRPMPVVMISSMTQDGADVTMKAMLLGAVDFVAKPRFDIANGIKLYADVIRTKLKSAAQCQVANRYCVVPEFRDTQLDGPTRRPQLIAIGASTGGIEAIHKLLSKLHAGLPPIVVTQHIPPVFSASFARRLNDQLALEVEEVADGVILQPSHVYIAPGNRHLTVRRKGSHLVSKLSDGETVNRHKPSVSVLFNSVAEVVGADAIGILLTGMGDDGAEGLLSMHKRGAVTIAQDQGSSVVWGMPREAIEINAVKHVMSLATMHGKLLSLCRERT